MTQQTFRKHIFLCFSDFSFFIFFFIDNFLKDSPRNVELPPWYGHDFHWGFKPVLSYSKPHTFSTFFGEEKERKNAFNLSNSFSRKYIFIPWYVVRIWIQLWLTNPVIRTLFTDETMWILIRTTRIAPTVFNLFHFYPGTDTETWN